MTANEMKTVSLVATAAVAMNAAHGAESADQLVAAIKTGDDKTRGEAWQNAAPAGAAAIKPLAALLTDPQFEIARSAKRALYKIIRHAGRPGASAEAQAAEKELIALLKNESALVRKEAAWMLSEIGSKEAIQPMAQLLTDKEVREDVRCALMRFPDSKATAAFKAAFSTAPEDFKSALAETLRTRGEKVKGYPSQRRVPTKQTSVGQPAKQG